MSSTKSIIVNCGSTQVGVAVFSTHAGRLVMDRLVVEDLEYDYANEDAWLGALVAKLTLIVKALKVEGPASIVVPGYQLLTKTVRVPQVEKSKQAQIIGFEAQNQIPYPLNEVVWDSQVIGTDGVEAEVMLFALKQDAANRLVGAVSSTGLIPTVVESSTLLDYQAWRAASPGDTDDVLLINVGARTTNLTFASPSGFSVHNVNTGGNFLTQQIADALAQPFRVAEAVKVAYFTSQKHLDESDPHSHELRKQAQSFMRKVSQEVTRRIVNYKRQNQGRAPAKIILTGRASLLPGFSEHLCETQRISVDYFDPAPAFARNDAVEQAYIDASRFQLGELIGEGVRNIMPNSVGVNLIPAMVATEMAFDKRKPVLLFAAALFAVAPWPVFYHYHNANAEAKAEVATVTARIAELQSYKTEMAKADAAIAVVKTRVEKLHTAAVASGNWRKFLADLQTRVSSVKDVWLDEVHFTRVAPKAVTAVVQDGEEPAAATPEVAPDLVDLTQVKVSLRMLQKDVAPNGTLNVATYKARRQEILTALKGSPFVAAIPPSEEIPNLKQANLPQLTLTLVIKQDTHPL